MDRRGVPEDAAQLWFQNNPKHRAFNAKFRELAAQHPELLTAAQELQAKKQALDALEERQREGGTLGRVFSGAGDEDGE